MKIVTSDEMRKIDADCGIPPETLMQRAAEAGVAACGEWRDLKITIVAGKGNNGGDGRVMGEILGAPVVESGTDFRGNALIVDAILGTGAHHRPFDERMRATIRAINASGARVISLDIPTGIHADTGQFLDHEFAMAVRADVTVTFGRAKPGLYLFPGAEYAGRVVVDGIGIPDSQFAAARGERLEPPVLPKKTPTAHKGESRLLVVGGSDGMTGAPLLAAMGALRISTGYVFISLPSGVNDPGIPIEAVRKPLASRDGKHFDRAAELEIFKFAETLDAIVYGGGFGIGEIERNIVTRLNRLFPIPAVIDGDALRQTALIDILEADAPRVLTPHPGEFRALFGGAVAENEADRIGVTLRAAKKCGHVVVHKGRPTIIADADGRYAINPTGDERLATCGSGDVLAGVIGGLLARKVPAYEAAVTAAWLHGKTVELWGKPVGLTATDVTNLLPEAWKAASPGA